MESGRKKLILDTSGINALADDPDCVALIRGLRITHLSGVTETTISEIAANSDEARRIQLLGVLERLLKFGMCVIPFHVIIEEQAKAYLADRRRYDWRRVNLRFAEAEGEVVRQESAVSEETRVTLKQWNQDFQAIFSDARAAFQKLFDRQDGKRPSLKEVADRMLGDGGAHREIAIDLFEQGTGTRPSQAEVHDFTERCLPFKALLVALCFSQYDRCIRGERQPWLGKAGRLDIFSAMYLPYCTVFVTNDDGQWKALRTVAKMIGRQMDILLYSEFKEKLFGIGVAAQ